MRRFRISTMILAAVLVAAAGWGIARYREQQRYKVMLQNMYQKSFYELVDGLGNMEITLSKLLVSEAPADNMQYLSDVWRTADYTQGSIGQLPIMDNSMNDTVKFINQIGDYCHSLLFGVAEGRPLNADNKEQIKALLERCASLSIAMRDLQRRVEDGGIELWSSVEPGEAGASGPMYDVARMGFEYPTLIYDGPFSDGANEMKGDMLKQKWVSAEDALRIAREYVGIDRAEHVRIAEVVAGEIPCHGVDVTLRDGSMLSLAVTRSGGHVLWMMPQNMPPLGEALSDDELNAAAVRFLALRGYGDMRLSYSQATDGLYVGNYTAVDGDVILYADLVKVQLNRANGDVIGIEAGNYLRNHRRRHIEAPVVTEEVARSFVPLLEVESARKTVIPTPDGERYCWELAGRLGGEAYLVYIDAGTGDEVEILRVIDAEGGKLTM